MTEEKLQAYCMAMQEMKCNESHVEALCAASKLKDEDIVIILKGEHRLGYYNLPKLWHEDIARASAAAFEAFRAELAKIEPAARAEYIKKKKEFEDL